MLVKPVLQELLLTGNFLYCCKSLIIVIFWKIVNYYLHVPQCTGKRWRLSPALVYNYGAKHGQQIIDTYDREDTYRRTN